MAGVTAVMVSMGAPRAAAGMGAMVAPSVKAGRAGRGRGWGGVPQRPRSRGAGAGAGWVARAGGGGESREEGAEREVRSAPSLPLPEVGVFEFTKEGKNPLYKSGSVIQLEDAPSSSGGGIGQMIASIGGRGKEGMDQVTTRALADSGEPLVWWFRSAGPPAPEQGQGRVPVVLVHEAPSQSYAFRNVIQGIGSKGGVACVAPDMVGFGYSSKPQRGFDGFDYTEDEYQRGFHDFVEAAVGEGVVVDLVLHGYVFAAYVLAWAAAHPGRVRRVVLLNVPLAEEAELPLQMRPFKIPLVDLFVSQNAILPERVIEGGGKYALELEDADIYRRPYLESSDAGFALLEVVRKYDVKKAAAKSRDAIRELVQDQGVPVTLAFGMDDKYLDPSAHLAAGKAAGAAVKELANVGHNAPEDWEDKVVEVVLKAFA